VAETVLVRDDITGSDERPVDVGRKNFRLQLDPGASQGEVSLPLARILRDGSGHFIFDPEYVPPCLQIGASETLLQLARRLVEILEAKSAAIEAERKGGGKELREYSSHEIANFWLLHAVRSSMAPLRHHLELKHSHPEQLYSEMARLAGALCTFAIDSDPRSLPAYDHDRLGECFAELERHIRAHLEIIIPTNCIAVPLKQVSDYLYVGPVADRRCFGGVANWILGVSSDLPRAELMVNVPARVKICSSQHVERLFRDALPGLMLQHLPSPPAAISPRIGYEYFSIGRSGPRTTQVCWDLISTTGEVGVYVPATLKGTGVDLMVVLTS
jgi:type VI secretion system protein ImpJ